MSLNQAYGRLRERIAILNAYSSLVGINFLLAGLSFATTLVVANLLGREGFGELSYALALGGYCLTIVYCGLEQTLVRDLVQSPERFEEVVSASLMLRGCMLVFALLALAAYNAVSPPEDRLGLAGILIVITEAVRALYLAEVYDAWRSARRSALYLLAERSLYFFCIWSVILLYRDRLSMGAIASFMFLSMSLGFFLQYRWAFPKMGIRFSRGTASLALKMLRGNLWVWGAVMGTLSFGTLSKIMLKRMEGNAELGGYSVAWQVVPLGLILISQASRLGRPYMAKLAVSGAPLPQRLRFIAQYATATTLAGAIIGVPTILFPEFLLLAFRPEFASAAGALRVLGVYVVLLGLGHVAVQYLISIRQERTYSLIVLSTGVLGTVLYVALIPRWSSEGAAISVVVAHGTAIAMYLVAAAANLFPRARAAAAGGAVARGIGMDASDGKGSGLTAAPKE